jgi:hypothetical protein
MEDVQATSPETEAEVQTPAGEDAPSGSPGFSERGRMRRRARFLRKARELAYRDLGGLVFNLHRFGQRNDALVLAKLSTLGQIDAELRTLEGALAEHQSVTVLRDAGIAACPRCAAIHGSEDRFCPNCGLAMDRRAERPVGAAPAAPASAAPVPGAGAAAGDEAALATPTTAPESTPKPAEPARTVAASPGTAVATATSAARVPPGSTGTSPATAAPDDYTKIERPASAPQKPDAAEIPPPAAPAAPARDAPAGAEPDAADPAEQDQPTVIVRPPGAGT